MIYNAKKIDEELGRVGIKELEETTKDDYLSLKRNAQTYLDNVRLLLNVYEDIDKTSQLIGKIKLLYNSIYNQQNFINKLLILQHDFEIQLNNFMGRTIYLTYVNEDGNILFYNDEHTNEIYQKATKNKTRGNISSTTMKSFDNINDVENKLQNEINDSIKRKMFAYTEAIRRYRKNKDEKAMQYVISKNTLYWRFNPPHVDFGKPINNEGRIAESYVGVVLNRMELFETESIIAAIDAGVSHDNIPAAAKGDIVYDKNTNIQFAVKKGSFSTASVRQYLVLAENLLKIDAFSSESLNENSNLAKLVRTGKGSKAVIENLNKNKANFKEMILSGVR